MALALELRKVGLRGNARGAGVGEPTLRPLSFVKAIANEYNSGTGLGASGKQVGGHCHFVIMDDVTDGSFEVRFWNGAATAGQGEWNTGGSMTLSMSLIWIDQSGVMQLTTLNGIKDTAAPFEETIHRHSGIRPKVGSHATLTYYATFTASGYYSHAKADYLQGEALRYGASGVPNYVGTNSIYTDTWNGAGDFWGPSFFGWSGGGLTRPTFVISGDSNHAGVYGSVRSDVPDTLDGALGSISRLLLPFMAGIDISIPGSTAAEMSDPAKTIYRDRIGGKRRGSVLVTPIGTNDIIFNGMAEAIVDANLTAYVSRLGFSQSFLPTIPPVVTSQASNTVYNSGRDAVRRSRNTALRLLSNVIDIAAGVESGVTPGTLLVLGDTVDGTHFNAPGNKREVSGSGFDVPSKVSGATAVSPGFQYASGAGYQNLNMSDFTAQASTQTNNSKYSPEHKTTAALLVEDGATSNHQTFKQPTIASLTSGAHSLTVFAKRVTGSRNLRIELYKSDFANHEIASVNLSDGTLFFPVTTPAGIFTACSVVTSLVDDYWKIVMNFTVNATLTNPYVILNMANASGINNYAGDGASSIALWGVDLR